MLLKKIKKLMFQNKPSYVFQYEIFVIRSGCYP